MTKFSLITLNSSDQPQENLEVMLGLIAQASMEGAQCAVLPEVANCMSSSRKHQMDVLQCEAQDDTLFALRAAAKQYGIALLIGSLALKSDNDQARFVNRSFLISSSGEIQAKYDKIHMFDVDLGHGETYRESDGYDAGSEAVLAKTPFGNLGMAICYDLRFPHLFRDLAKAGAEILALPAAFTVPTGKAHWETLLRARAIENGCFVLAPAQTGQHRLTQGAPRQTYGHSLVVSPWGEIVYDGGDEPGIGTVDIDLSQVAQARRKIPSLQNEKEYSIKVVS